MYDSEQTNQNSLLSHAKYLVSLIKNVVLTKFHLFWINLLSINSPMRKWIYCQHFKWSKYFNIVETFQINWYAHSNSNNILLIFT